MSKVFNEIMKKFWQEFIYGGHLVALTAFAIMLTIIILLYRNISWELPIIGYLLTFIFYRYNYYKEIKKDLLTNLQRAQFLKKHIKYSKGIILFYSLIASLILILFTNYGTVLFALFLFMAGICYTLWLKEYTKKIVGFKNLYVSICWGSYVILVGFYYSDFNWSLFIIFLFIFLKGILNTVFFDIKDIATDKKERLKTIPVVLGEKRNLNFLHILNFFSFFPLLTGIYLNFLPRFTLIMLFFFFYDFYYIEKAKDKNINIQKLSYLIADGEFLLWPIVLFLGKIVFNL